MERVFEKILPKFIWKLINKNPELRKILVNMNWLFLDKVIQMGVAFFVGVWVIRYLGPERYGILSYALAFTALFGVLSKLGLEAILVRELVDNKIKKEKLLGTAFLIKLTGAILAIIFSVLSIFLIRNGDMLVVSIALIISLGFIFRSFDIIDYWFQSKVEAKAVAYSRSIAIISSGLLKIGLILFGAPLLLFAIVILVESIIFSLGLICSYWKNKQKIRIWKFDWIVAKKIFQDSWPVTLSSLSIIIYMKIDQVMIGSMLDDQLLGNYSAAVALSEIWMFIPAIIVSSVFPAIIYARKNGRENYHQRLQSLYDVLLWLPIAIAIPISIFSSQIIILLFGDSYQFSANVLSIYIWSGIFVFLNYAIGRYLIAENMTKIIFTRSLMGAIVNIGLNLFLIPIYGIVGAAIATVFSYGCATLFSVLPRKSRINFVLIMKSFNISRIIRQVKGFLN